MVDKNLAAHFCRETVRRMPDTTWYRIHEQLQKLNFNVDWPSIVRQSIADGDLYAKDGKSTDQAMVFNIIPQEQRCKSYMKYDPWTTIDTYKQVNCIFKKGHSLPHRNGWGTNGKWINPADLGEAQTKD